MLFLYTHNLLTQPLINRRVWILRRCAGITIVDRINTRQQIVRVRFVSIRVVPKSSRTFCGGLEKASAMPLAVPFGLRSSGPFATGHNASNGWTSGTAAAREASSGTKARALRPRF